MTATFDDQLAALVTAKLGPKFVVTTWRSGRAYAITYLPNGDGPLQADQTASVVAHLESADRRHAPTDDQAEAVAVDAIEAFTIGASDTRFTEQARTLAAEALVHVRPTTSAAEERN